jgi:hypothetical protein
MQDEAHIINNQQRVASRTKSREQKEENSEQRAASREQRAESRKQKQQRVENSAFDPTMNKVRLISRGELLPIKVKRDRERREASGGGWIGKPSLTLAKQPCTPTVFHQSFSIFYQRGSGLGG